jgi:hypothetical protein
MSVQQHWESPPARSSETESCMGCCSVLLFWGGGGALPAVTAKFNTAWAGVVEVGGHLAYVVAVAPHNHTAAYVDKM